MQRRANLIPQLTQIAETYLSHEAQVSTNLSAARITFLAAETPSERSAADAEVRAAIADFQAFAGNST